MLGENGWVEHCDNGVKYVFDVTSCMFSAGNISEKLRMASLDCRSETVVDLFAGVGYFTLPILVHGRAKMVHACDWNESALEGLKRGLIANEVADCCVIHYGDNVQVSAQKQTGTNATIMWEYILFMNAVWDNFVIFDITRFYIVHATKFLSLNLILFP